MIVFCVVCHPDKRKKNAFAGVDNLCVSEIPWAWNNWQRESEIQTQKVTLGLMLFIYLFFWLFMFLFWCLFFPPISNITLVLKNQEGKNAGRKMRKISSLLLSSGWLGSCDWCVRLCSVISLPSPSTSILANEKQTSKKWGKAPITYVCT